MESTPPTAAPETATTEQKDALPASYAWRRYFARAFDIAVVMTLIILVVAMIITIIVAITDRGDLQAYLGVLQRFGNINHFVDAIVTGLLWLPIEALLLRVFGATPGKWIFGIQVRTHAGSLLGYNTAITRALLVFVTGQGFSLPLISLIALIFSYDRLIKTGTTNWDRDMGTMVNYVQLSQGRLVLCAVAVLAWALVAFWSVIHYFST